MAGQRPTYYTEAEKPATFVLTFAFPFPSANANVQYLHLFTAPFDLVIEEVTLRYSAAAGSARTANLAKVDDGTDPASASTDITVTNGINLNSTTNTNVTPSFRCATSASTAADASKPPSENIVTRNQLVMLKANGSMGAALAGLVITLRCSAIRH